MSHEEVYLAVAAFTLPNADCLKLRGKGTDEPAETEELKHSPVVLAKFGMNLQAGREIIERRGKLDLTGDPGEPLSTSALEKGCEESDFASVIDG